MSRATGLAGRGLRGVDGAAVAQRHHQRREAVLPAVELLGMYVCSPPPPHRYLSWMPLAHPWGIQVGDTDVGTRPPGVPAVVLGRINCSHGCLYNVGKHKPPRMDPNFSTGISPTSRVYF